MIYCFGGFGGTNAFVLGACHMNPYYGAAHISRRMEEREDRSPAPDAVSGAKRQTEHAVALTVQVSIFIITISKWSLLIGRSWP